MNYAERFDSHLSHGSPVSLGGERFAFESKLGFVQHQDGASVVVVPDAHLLFSGDYTRIGNDLIISDGDKKFVVGSYFKGENRPALSTTEGATLAGHIVETLTGHVQYAQAAPQAPGEIIGHVLKLSGSATAIRNGVSIELHIGDAVQKGDVIQTGSDSTIGMTFIDGSAFGMTSNARMVLNEMIYDPNGSSNSSLISLVQGTITFVAGQTAKNGNMRVDTPVATMGIRGTAVLVEIGAQDGPTKFSVLVEPDGYTGSYNLYDKSTGQLIGTVSQAGQVTFVSSMGIGQPPTAIEQLKTLQDQQAEKAIIQQVFQLFFPNYNPDDSKPNSTKFGGSSGNNLASISITTVTFNDQTFIQQIALHFTPPPSQNGQQGPGQTVLYNTKAIFATTPVTAEQSFVTSVDTFKIADHVLITDPDIGTAPFFDIATPFVAGSAVIISAVSTNPHLDAAFLTQFIHIDQNTGVVSFDRLSFNFLGIGESVTFMLQVTARSGPDSAQVVIPITITGLNDTPNGSPTIVTGPATQVAGSVKEDTNVNAQDQITTHGTITFQDVDLTDTHTASFVFTSSSSNLPGFTQGQHLGTFTIDPVSEDTTDTNNTGTVGWHFTLDDSNPVLQSLAEGEEITQVYTITIKDNHGAYVTQTVTITIIGTNDVPTVLSSTTPCPTSNVVEDGVQTTTGVITFQDVDLIDTHHVTEQLVSGSANYALPGFNPATTPLGTLSFTVHEDPTDTNNTGSVDWTFTLDNSLAQQLAEGQVVTQTYTVFIIDNSGAQVAQNITVTITGTNDAPTIVSSVTPCPTSNVVEDGVQTTTGVITFQDVDLIDTHQVAEQLSGGSLNHGQVGFDPATTPLGTLSYTLHEDPTDTSNTGTVDWTFTLDNSLAQQLAEGQVVTQSYTITITDNHGAQVTQVVTVTITGTNDAPTLANVTAGTLVDTAAWDTFADLTGHLTGSDVDYGETALLTYAVLDSHGHAVNTAVEGLYGTLTVNSDGTYVYEPNAAAINALQAGHYTDTFTIETIDPHGATGTATFSVNIDGANDTPVLNVMDQYVTEGVTARGFNLIHTFTMHDLLATDADAGNDIFTLTTTAQDGKMSLAGHNEGLTVTGVGTKSMTISGSLDAINDALTGGSHGLTYSTGLFETGVERITAVLTDGHGASDTVNFIFQQNDLSSGTLTGTSGKDVIFSNLGNDIMWGMGGNDVFVFSGLKGNDVIKDFQQGDQIMISNAFSSYADLLAHTTDVHGNAVISLASAGPGSITIVGVDKAHLTASDFHIV